MSVLKDVLLVGFGAVGAVYSLVLKKSGLARVTVVARSNYEFVKANGMHFQSQKYGDIKGWRPDRLCATIEEAAKHGPYSHVVLTTKAVPELLTTPELLKPLLTPPYSDSHPQPTYVLMQNGLNIEIDLYKVLKALKPAEEPRIISTSVYIGTRSLTHDVVEHNYFDRVLLGMYRPIPNIMTNTPEESVVLSEFGDMLAKGGTEITIVPEIQRIKFTKNIWNCVLGPATALPRFSLHAVFRAPHFEGGAANTESASASADKDDPNVERTPSQIATANIPYAFPQIHDSTIPFLYDAFTEVSNLGQALFPPTEEGPGIDPNIAQNILTNTAAIFVKPTSTERPSMLVDCELGRPMELEVIVGEVVRMGRKMGVPMPRIETFYNLMLIIQMQFLHRQAQKRRVA